MRIYISADLEGVAGVVSPDQLLSGPGYEKARGWMTAEVAAAIRGAQAAGARSVVVNDAHETMANLLLDQLPSGIHVITGRPKTFGMMNGVDAGFDLAFFIGYHSRIGRTGVLNHSYSARLIDGLKLNGLEIGELSFNAALAGYFNVPVGLVAGDEDLSLEADPYLADSRFVAVKSAASRQSARTMLPADASGLIEEAAFGVTEACIQGNLPAKPWCPEPPFHLQVDFHHSVMADIVAYMPTVCRRDPRSVEFVHDELPTVYKAFQAMMVLAGSVPA